MLTFSFHLLGCFFLFYFKFATCVLSSLFIIEFSCEEYSLGGQANNSSHCFPLHAVFIKSRTGNHFWRNNVRQSTAPSPMSTSYVLTQLLNHDFITLWIMVQWGQPIYPRFTYPWNLFSIQFFLLFWYIFVRICNELSYKQRKVMFSTSLSWRYFRFLKKYLVFDILLYLCFLSTNYTSYIYCHLY